MINFNFSEDYVLENERVQLRPLQLSDFKNLLYLSQNEPELWKFSLVSAAGEDGLKNYIHLALEAKKLLKEYPFIVFDKQKQKYAGCTKFYDIQLASKTLQLGYTWYGKEFQGTGLNKACKYLLLEFAFDELGIERVEFRADNRNEKSIAAMKSIGCKVEGVLRSTGFAPDGNRRDSIVLSILKDEWDTEVKLKLHLKTISVSSD